MYQASETKYVSPNNFRAIMKATERETMPAKIKPPLCLLRNCDKKLTEILKKIDEDSNPLLILTKFKTPKIVEE